MITVLVAGWLVASWLRLSGKGEVVQPGAPSVAWWTPRSFRWQSRRIFKSFIRPTRLRTRRWEALCPSFQAGSSACPVSAGLPALCSIATADAHDERGVRVDDDLVDGGVSVVLRLLDEVVIAVGSTRCRPRSARCPCGLRCLIAAQGR